MIINEQEYIIGLLKRDGISYGDNSVHVSYNQDHGYDISIGGFSVSGDTIVALNFMFEVNMEATDEGLEIFCVRREK